MEDNLWSLILLVTREAIKRHLPLSTTSICPTFNLTHSRAVPVVSVLGLAAGDEPATTRNQAAADCSIWPSAYQDRSGKAVPS